MLLNVIFVCDPIQYIAKFFKMIDFFGYLNIDYSLCFNDVRIIPIEKYAEVKSWINKYANKDGFLYPPRVHNIELDFKTFKTKRVIPNTEKPAQLHRIPYSHSINIQRPLFPKELRKGDYAFMINVLALVFGTRLQFHNWWFDGKIPIKNFDNIIISPNSMIEFLETVYETWKSWKDINKERIINLLIMHSRILTYEWDFERFMLNYLVFDGAFSIAQKVYNCQAGSHKKQFYSVIDKFGIARNEEYINHIYNLRNDLFHYAIWDGGYPSSAANKYKGWMQETFLRKFNIRLLIALLNYKTGFIETPWWTVNTASVDAKYYK